jgi:DNA-directed RNA polymerase specialized sigma24 family protein
MLGSWSEVDDAVQEAWLRLSRADTTGIDNLGRWLTTVAARVCPDMLRSRQSRREESFTRDAPEPAATGIEVMGNPARLGELDVSIVDRHNRSVMHEFDTGMMPASGR